MGLTVSAMSRWTQEEIASLLQMDSDGKSPKEISKALSRTEGAVKQRLRLVSKSSIAVDVKERGKESKPKAKDNSKSKEKGKESKESEVAKWRRITKAKS